MKLHLATWEAKDANFSEHNLFSSPLGDNAFSDNEEQRSGTFLSLYIPLSFKFKSFREPKELKGHLRTTRGMYNSNIQIVKYVRSSGDL